MLQWCLTLRSPFPLWFRDFFFFKSNQNLQQKKNEENLLTLITNL